MKKTILFYVHMKDPTLFYTQRFYINTKDLLESLGYNVIVSHKIGDAWKLRYDGLFVFFYKIGVVAAFLSKLRGKKVFFYGGMDDLNKQTTPFFRYNATRLVVFLCVCLADWCLVESKTDMNNLKKLFLHKLPRNIHYSPQAIDLSLYQCDVTQKKNLFTTVCLLSERNIKRKGVDISLYYFCRLKHIPQFQDAKYIIMGRDLGGGSYLKKIISTLGLDDSVSLTGEIPDAKKIALLKASRYYFQLSHYEGFGLAALEAIASNCLVIHTGEGGLSDTIADDGLLIDIGKFNYSLESINPDILKLPSEIGTEFFDKWNLRSKQFDIPNRKEVFYNTIGKTLPTLKKNVLTT